MTVHTGDLATQGLAFRGHNENKTSLNHDIGPYA